MNALEMHQKIALKLQKFNSFAFDDFRPEEIDIFLNSAQEVFVKQRSSKHSDPKQIGFAGDQKRLNDIRQLITPYEQDCTRPDVSGQYFFSLPQDFYLELTTTVRALFDMQVAKGDSRLRVIPVRVIENDRYDEDQQNPYRKPTVASLPGQMIGDLLQVNFDERYILIGIRMTYIRMPKKIELALNSSSTDCELPQHTHSEIVDLAVSQILEVIESQRYQSSKIEAAQSE